MIQFRHDDFVAGPVGTSQCPREMKGERGHVRAKRDFVRRGVQKIGQRRSCPEDNGVSLDAGGKRPVSIGVVVEQIVAHRIHDRGWNLGAAGSVEVGDRFLAVEAAQSGKMSPDGGNGSHRR